MGARVSVRERTISPVKFSAPYLYLCPNKNKNKKEGREKKGKKKGGGDLAYQGMV
jgi:hypothetical protein